MSQQGKTLIELMITLCVIAIVSTGVVPGFALLLQEQRLRSATNDLHRAIYAARHEASSRQTSVSLSNTDGNWASGMELFTDDNKNGRRDAGEVLIRRFGGQPSLSITGNRWVASYISYRADGSAYTRTGAFQVGTFKICEPGYSPAYKLVLSIGGRLRRERHDHEACE